MNHQILKTIIIAVIFFLISFPLIFSIVPLKHVKEIHIILSVNILAVDDFSVENLGYFNAEIPSEKKGFLGKAIEIKGNKTSETIGIEIEALAKPKGDFRFLLDVKSHVTPLDLQEEKKYSRREEFEILEDSSHLMEVYRSVKTGKNIILNIAARKKEVETFKVSNPSTTKVRFQLNIYRISKGKEILLERNSLSTLLHQTASYYLHLFAEGKKGKKEGLAEEELDIRMTPLEIANEAVDLEVDIQGKILRRSREEIPVHIKKVENIANAESFFISVASEEMEEKTQEGYKFEIIPIF